MALKSRIEWTQATWNPVTGCSEISEGCKNCYARKLSRRLKAMGCERYRNEFDVTVHYDMFLKPLEWKKPKLIFVNSMSDLFHDKLKENDILQIFETMNKADWHIFQVLTKRPERMLEMSGRIPWAGNIWMGVTAENQRSLYRCDLLRKCGASVKFISAEPLLESLEGINLEGIDWLITGGESGTGSRPVKEEWIKYLRDKAQENKVPFFFKQWGGVHPKQKGSCLEGKEYKEFPVCFDKEKFFK